MSALDRVLSWEPEQRTFLSHVIWRWTGALLQDLILLTLRRKRVY